MMTTPGSGAAGMPAGATGYPEKHQQRQTPNSDKNNKTKNGGANRNRTDDLLNAIQTLSQLSYGPIPWDGPAGGPAEARVFSSRAPHRTQAPNPGASGDARRSQGSALVAALDVEVEVLVLFLVFLEEGIFVVVADILDVLDVLDVGDFLVAVLAGFFGIGVLERDAFRL